MEKLTWLNLLYDPLTTWLIKTKTKKQVILLWKRINLNKTRLMETWCPRRFDGHQLFNIWLSKKRSWMERIPIWASSGPWNRFKSLRNGEQQKICWTALESDPLRNKKLGRRDLYRDENRMSLLYRGEMARFLFAIAFGLINKYIYALITCTLVFFFSWYFECKQQRCGFLPPARCSHSNKLFFGECPFLHRISTLRRCLPVVKMAEKKNTGLFRTLQSFNLRSQHKRETVQASYRSKM